MAENTNYDLVVIGGGPAGYAAAIRAGQLGKKVACLETERAGGTCLNWGCIPSKALLKTAELYRKLHHLEDFGLSCQKPSFDFQKVIARSRTVSDQMAKGIEFLFKKNKVDYFVGTGRISVPGMVEVTSGPDQGKFFKTENIMIATGCRSRRLPGIEVDGERIMTSREALVVEKLPKSITILGAGAIGAEFAYFFNALGSEVTLVEMLPQVLPQEDQEISRVLERSFKKQGMTVHKATRLEDLKVLKNEVKYTLKPEKGDAAEGRSESLLLAIGVVPNLDGAVSPKVRIDLDDRGYVKVGDDYQTSVPGVYAAGDIIGPPWLAHTATYEAVQAVNGMFGDSKPRRVTLFPACTYCQPQVASQGMTEQTAKEKGIAYKVGKFPFSASGKAVAAGEPEGFIKILSAEADGEILGVHIIGAEATELIAEFGLAMSLEATAEEVHASIHAHPTLSEGLGEAAAAVSGEAIHI